MIRTNRHEDNDKGYIITMIYMFSKRTDAKFVTIKSSSEVKQFMMVSLLKKVIRRKFLQMMGWIFLIKNRWNYRKIKE